jgi:hypothetical protein
MMISTQSRLPDFPTIAPALFYLPWLSLAELFNWAKLCF